MARRKFALIALAGAVALIAAACGGGGDDGDTDTAQGGGDCTWVIGTMGALSGDYASLGVPIMRGVELAVDQANEAGDLQCELELQKEDSQGSPDQAPPLVQSLVENEDLVACVCPYFSGETLATGQIFSDAGVMFGGTATNETIDEQGYETWFRAVAPDNVQAEVAAQYIQEVLQPQTVAVIHDNQDYSKGLADAVKKNLGDTAVGPFIINPEETDYSAVITKVKAANPDVIFYGGYTPQAGPLSKQLEEAGVTAQFVSDDGAKDPSYGELAGASAEGDQVTCPCVDPLKVESASDFVEAHKQSYNRPPGTFAADMYDMTNIVLEALRSWDGDATDIDGIRQHVVEHFDQATDVAGAAKTYSWNDDGEFEADPLEAIWIYEWSDKAGDFVSKGSAAELLGG